MPNHSLARRAQHNFQHREKCTAKEEFLRGLKQPCLDIIQSDSIYGPAHLNKVLGA